MLVGLALLAMAALTGFLGGTIASGSGSGSATLPAIQVSEPAPGGLDVPAVVASAGPSVVSVNTDAGEGTGFVVTAGDTDERFVVTNAHVIGGSSRVEVVTADERRLPAEVLGQNPNADLAVLRVDGLDLAALTVRTDPPVVGEPVVAIGNALGLGVTPSVTTGIVSAVDRSLESETGDQLSGLVQTDTAINPGNSGGPLLDARGRVIGVNTAIIDPALAQNVGFAISADTLMSMLAQLTKGTRLGVQIEPADPGARVVEVTEGSGAAAAGLRAGDVILAIDGDDIAGPADLISQISARSPGDTITLQVQRDGQTIGIDVTLQGS